MMLCLVLSPGIAAAEPLSDYGPVVTPTEVVRPGAVVWMDLLTADVERAATFYTEVFEWEFSYSPDRSYAYGTVGGQPVAAIAAYEEEIGAADGLWIPSLSVPDVDQAMAAVKTNGGSLVGPPEELPGRGRYVLIEDPTGAAVMLLRAEGGDPGRSEIPNQWLWTELWTDDTGKATGFYKKVVGYGTVDLKDSEGHTITVLGRDQQPHASVVKTPLPDVDPAWLAYLLVEDVNATAQAIQKAGGEVLLAPQKDGFNDNVAIVADPTGGVFALQQKEAGR
jgi:predicted enzyme related to lactoylglutathione lyase